MIMIPGRFVVQIKKLLNLLTWDDAERMYFVFLRIFSKWKNYAQLIKKKNRLPNYKM